MKTLGGCWGFFVSGLKCFWFLVLWVARGAMDGYENFLFAITQKYASTIKMRVNNFGA
jgi:hypothetical protein